MDHRTIAQLWALVFLAAAVTATAIQMTRKHEPREIPAVHLVPPQPDPLQAGQRRCQQLGQAAATDAVCLQVWSETRDRFLGREATPAATADEEGPR